MKKNATCLLLFVSLFIGSTFGQEFIELSDSQEIEINGLLVGYTSVLKESKKDSDLYRITTTITNRGDNYIRIFESSPDVFTEKPDNALAYFQFTNATGKALSATSAYFYPKPMYIKVPYKCKKCPPIAKDEDPYEHYVKSIIIGTQFVSGSTLTSQYNIRVDEGVIPKVRVMVY